MDEDTSLPPPGGGTAAEERDDEREVGPRGSSEVEEGAQPFLVSFDESWMGGRDGRGTVDGVDDVQQNFVRIRKGVLSRAGRWTVWEVLR